jgi:hypothetical protein
MMSNGKNGFAWTLSALILNRKWPPAHGYAFAVSVVLIAFLLRYFLIGVLDDRAIYIFFVPPILLASLIGGFGPGALTVVLPSVRPYISGRSRRVAFRFPAGPRRVKGEGGADPVRFSERR